MGSASRTSRTMRSTTSSWRWQREATTWTRSALACAASPAGDERLRHLLSELESLELTAVAPLVDVLEERHRSRGIADEELPARPRVLTFVVVVAGRAVGGADHQAGTG